ncbi:MAG TPA: hypothetical protein VEZ19_01200 [Rubrobacter sp.]|nr:hypothetical protein [Rubrobacter sp.]
MAPVQSEGPGPRRTPATRARPSLLLLVLEPGDEHLLGPLGGLQVVLQDAPEEIDQLLVAILLGVLDVGLSDSTLSEEW